ncbi:MAG: hypothetical protein IPK91_08905 [Saprospiraceae bacterium]|nr:hypothetical protein [Saprospiraceae bacterium]MBK8297377.1 hypothetical protein [Saprospiraceae bacterium]
MKYLNNFNITILICCLALNSCSKNENNDSIPFKKSYSLKTRSQSLEAILSNGITSADDLDVLRSNSVYPFCEVSSNLFNNYKSNLIFDEGILACAGSWIGPSLTKNQFKIWYQILCHANITTIENFGFLANVPNEQQYSNITGYGNADALPGYYQEKLEDDCGEGWSECIQPF